MSNTTEALATLETLLAQLGAEDSLNPIAIEVRQVRNATIEGLIRRDMAEAMRKAGESVLSVPGVSHCTEQTDWRDNVGYRCTTERGAEFVARWAERYLDPKDADGNTIKPRARRMIQGEGWFVAVRSYKIGD